jgi:hypothetical protein
MSIPVHELEAEVLGLPPEERARLLERLIESFEPESRVRDAWIALSLTREAEVKSGKVALVPGPEAVGRCPRKNRVSYWLHPEAEAELGDAAVYYGEHASKPIASSLGVDLFGHEGLLADQRDDLSEGCQRCIGGGR